MPSRQIEVDEVKRLYGEDFGIVFEALTDAPGVPANRIAKVGIKWLATLIRKNTDYGCSVWKVPILAPECSPGSAIRVRMSDKVSRLNQLLSSDDSPLINESIDDTLADLGSYCLLELARPGRESDGSIRNEEQEEKEAESYRMGP